MAAAQKAKKMVLAVEVPRDELALRIARVCLQMKPPRDLTATEALEQLKASPADTANGFSMVESFRSAADAAVLYFHECVNAGRQPS